MLLIILVFCVFVLCLVNAKLPVSLGCLFLIALSVFSNVSHKTRFSWANVYSKAHNWPAVSKGSGASIHHERTLDGHRKPRKWAVIYLSVNGIDFASFFDFDIWFWNCSNYYVFFLLFLILLEVSVIIICPTSNGLHPTDSTSVSSAFTTLAAIVLSMFMLSFFPVRVC